MLYYLLCLTAGLLVVATLSASLVRHLRWSFLRDTKAAELLEALAQYSQWVAAQRLVEFFGNDTGEAGTPLNRIEVIGRECFPEITRETQQLLAVHASLVGLLQTQLRLRLQDPEAWLDCDRDSSFMRLWLLHRQAIEAIKVKLKLAMGISELEARPDSAAAADSGGEGRIRTDGTV